MRLRFISDNWKDLRSHQTQKWKNYTYIENFENALKTVTLDYDIDVEYYNAKRDSRLLSTIQYYETTPFVKQIKLSPKGYFLDEYSNLDLWRYTDINSNIVSLLGSPNKYNQPQEQYVHDRPYILFALQSLNFINPNYMHFKQFAKVMVWAEHHKIDVLFKLHPFNRKNDPTMKYWEQLRKNNAGGDYVHLISADYNLDHLIENSEGVWTHSSGVGLQALLYDKPVVNMSSNIDWACISNVYHNPLQTEFKKTTREDVLRFLSWYYHKLTIDSTADNLKDLIELRITKIVENDYDIERIYK